MLSMAIRNLSLTTTSQRNLCFYNCFSCSLNPSKRHSSPDSVFLPDATSTYNPLVFQAAKLLGPPATFDASKLEVVFKGEKNTRIVPRTYRLSHCDFTANLTLTISNVIDHDQIKGWYNKDDVVAQWAEVKGHLCLDVHCYVSGPNSWTELAAEFRYYIFSKEMPLVLEAVLYGDRLLFSEHKELRDAFVRVFFHSSSRKYNRVECWGPLKDAAKGRVGDHIQGLLAENKERSVQGRVGDHIQGLLAENEERSAPSDGWGIPKSVFQVLCTFLL